MYNLDKVRADFPILSRTVYDRPLVYLDNAATTQKPLCVLDAMRDEYLNANANVHRGVHYLSQQATDLHEAAREAVRRFINAGSTSEIVFTRGTTESINLVASSFCEAFMQPGDEVIVSVMEHHSNIVPWQLQAARRGITIRVAPMSDSGELLLDEMERLFTERTKIVSIAHVSNVLGTVNPVDEIVRMAHAHGVPVLVDGAQSAPHFKVDVRSMDCDFFVLSGHKMYGPTGIGVLYGKESWLDRLPPYQGGGEMIESVTRESAVYAQIPHKFEAGTVNAAGAAALAEAVRYIKKTGFDTIQERERCLTEFAMKRMKQIPGVNIIGSPDAALHNGIISFTLEGVHPHDTASILDADRIGVRAGHHCAQPLLAHLGIPSCTRVSLAFYNTCEEIELFADSLSQIRRKMGYGE